MAVRKQSAKSEGRITAPRSRRIKTLPSGPDTTIHYEGDKLAVVVFRKNTGGGAGGIKRPTIDICKCTKTVYKCTTTSEGNTICKEECTEWDCKTIETAL
jgi:hypothetical protein